MKKNYNSSAYNNHEPILTFGFLKIEWWKQNNNTQGVALVSISCTCPLCSSTRKIIFFFFKKRLIKSVNKEWEIKVELTVLNRNQ